MTRITLTLRFHGRPNVPQGIRQAIVDGQLKDLDPDIVSYCIGRETVICSGHCRGMAAWREEVFALMQRNAEETANYFSIPTQQFS